MVEQPADVGGELLRLRAGQEHAVVEGVQEPVLGNPAPALHELLMHDGNLPRGPPEADEAKLQPEGKRFAERQAFGRRGGSPYLLNSLIAACHCA